MSRKKRDLVWEQYFDNKDVGLCPCCRRNMLVKKSKRREEGAWEREHIIKLQHGGPDVMANLIPICPDCNRNNKPFHNTYYYMVSIGILTEKEAVERLSELTSRLDDLRKNPEKMQCYAITQKGEQCSNAGMSITCPFCKTHRDKYEADVQRMNTTWEAVLQRYRQIYGDYINHEHLVAMWEDICGRVNLGCINMDIDNDESEKNIEQDKQNKQNTWQPNMSLSIV